MMLTNDVIQLSILVVLVILGSTVAMLKMYLVTSDYPDTYSNYASYVAAKKRKQKKYDDAQNKRKRRFAR